MKPLGLTITLIFLLFFSGHAYPVSGEISTAYFDLVRTYKSLSLGTHLDIAVNSKGNILVADGDRHRILRVDPGTGQTEVFRIKLQYQDKPFTPYGIFVDSVDTLYIANPDLHTVLIIDTNGNIIKRIGGFGSFLERPVDIVIDANGTLYVLDVIGPKVHILDSNSNTLESIQIGKDLQGSSINSLVVGSNGNIFVTDRGLRKVLMITPKQRIFEFGPPGYEEGQLIAPTGITIGERDNLFITDYLNNALYQFDNTGRLIKEHLLVKEFLKQPSAITFRNNYAYIINKGKNEILQFELKYAVTGIAHELLGGKYFEGGFYSEAIQELNTAIKLGNASPDIHYLLGVSYYNLKDFQSSIEHLKIAVRGNPEDTEAIFQLGNAYHRMNDFNRAIESYRRVLFIRPNHLLAHYNLGEAYWKTGDINRAERHFKEALLISPDYIDAKIGLGRVLLQNNENREAGKVFSEILEKNPGVRQVKYFLGLALYKQQKYEKAIEVFSRVSQEGPYYIDSLYHLGLSYKAMGKEQQARKTFEIVISLRPDHQEAMKQLR